MTPADQREPIGKQVRRRVLKCACLVGVDQRFDLLKRLGPEDRQRSGLGVCAAACVGMSMVLGGFLLGCKGPLVLAADVRICCEQWNVSGERLLQHFKMQKIEECIQQREWLERARCLPIKRLWRAFQCGLAAG